MAPPDADGHELAKIQEKIEVEDGPDLDIQGNLVDHEYTFGHDHDTVATVSEQWVRVADTYNVEVAPDQDPHRSRHRLRLRLRLRRVLLPGHRGPHLALAVDDQLAGHVDGHGVQRAGEPVRRRVVRCHR